MARPDTLQWAAGKGSLPEEPTGKPEASGQAERGQLLLEGTLGGHHPGQPGSLPEGQVVVVPLPPGEGVALPPPQIGFHAYPELVWYSTAGPLHPPRCTEPPLNTPACWALPLPGSPPSPTLPPLASSCPLYGCGGGEGLSQLRAPHQENGSDLVLEDWVPSSGSAKVSPFSALSPRNGRRVTLRLLIPDTLCSVRAHQGCGFGSHHLCQIQSKA